MKTQNLTLPESYVALKHHANRKNRMSKCYKMLMALKDMKNVLGDNLAYYIIEADKFMPHSDKAREQASLTAKTMKRYEYRIIKLTNYYNSLVHVTDKN